jgi:hypothetical protein
VAQYLSDAQWEQIVALRRPCVPEATARAELDRVLVEYRRFDPKKLKAERAELFRIVKLASELEAALRRRKALPWPEVEGLAPILKRAQRTLNRLDRYISDRARRIPLEHLLLLGRLFDIWVELFGGELNEITDPPGRRGLPSGKLVRFVLAATKDIDPPIKPNTIRYLARDEQAARLEYAERKRRLRVLLRAMMPGNGNLRRKK